MGQSASGSQAAQQAAVPGRRGTCRLCFDDGGDLIAPCLCRGSSKWIHRECLNQWRVSGSNPRALTNCCECGFQYRLKLKRNDALSSEGEVRRRQLMRRLASQTLLGFVGLQLLVCGVGCVIRAVDAKEGLVRFFGFPQVQGHAGPGSFIDALKYHKITYYVSAVIFLLALTGFFVCVGLLVACCRGSSARDQSRQCSPLAVCQVGVDCCCPRHADPCDMYIRMRMCEDCSRCCIVCCSDCSRNCGSGNCIRGTGFMNIFGGNNGRDFAGVVAVLIIIVVVAFVLVGLFAAAMALVASMQKAGQEWAKIQQLRVMATEYEVQDLADPTDLGDAVPEAAPGAAGAGPSPQQAMATGASFAPSAPPRPQTEEELQAQASAEWELAEMFGGGGPTSLAGEQALRGYGAA